MVKFLMMQGTSSNAGKSSLVTALCRILSDMGYKVTPMKSQNMSSNVHIMKDGREIAKAQAIQAIAARTEANEYMNPILLKPMGDYVSRVVLLGRTYRDMHAKYYYDNFVMRKGIQYVKKAIKKLSEYDVVVIEGAGNPAEINIADHDIANMKLAEMLNAPVIIVADIDRGGCFASIVGTMQLLKQKHRKLVKGFIINKFRGDKNILDPAIEHIEKITGKPVLGIIPLIDDMLLPNEDSLGIDAGRSKHEMINIALIRYPNAINLSDFDSLLKSSNALNAYHVNSAGKLEDADLILLPASRDLYSDLEWMRKNGIVDEIRSLKARKPVIGICEGFAMMGRKILNGVSADGLNLINTTVYAGRKLAGNVSVRAGRKAIVSTNGRVFNAFLRGDYRIVNGRNAYPLFHVLRLNGKNKRFAEGSVSKDGLALGCCLYGLFDDPAVRDTLITFLARRKKIKVAMHGMETTAFWDKQIQRFSNTVKNNIEMERIMKLVRL